MLIHQRKGKEQSLNVQSEIEFARQGIPFEQFVQTQLDFPHFGALYLFNLKIFLRG